MRGRTLFALFTSVMAVTCSASRPLRTASPAPPGASVPSEPTARPQAPETASPETAAPERAAFDEKIRPILARTCAPCHNPGGKMYSRLPFDDPEVVGRTARGSSDGSRGPTREPSRNG
jgi:hypothetical protein